MKKLGSAILAFLKKFIPVWIVLGVCLTLYVIDAINASGYEITLVKAYTDDNPEGDMNKLYFATPEKEEIIHLDLQITAFGKPKSNHSIVGVEKKAGNIQEARKKTDENGICTFNFSCYPEYDEYLESKQAEILFYEESSALLIEVQVRTIVEFTLYRR